jgi:hypothetical protein
MVITHTMIGDKITYDNPNADRIVIIGDIHGDIKRFRNILIDAKIINMNIDWIAEPPNTIVVQLGDQVDSMNRSPDASEWEVIDDVQMLHFTDCLDKVARAKGGRLISLIGNHEMMNVIGNFSYVSDKSKMTNRQGMFAPRGSLSNTLANRPIVLKIGGLFFCHAGIKKSHLDVLNKYGKDISHLNAIWSKFMLTNEVTQDDVEIFNKIIMDGEDGILWTRTVDNPDDSAYVMKTIGCQYIFIGHTPVTNIQLVNKTIWLTDTGISRAFGTSTFEYLEINKNVITVHKMEDK